MSVEELILYHVNMLLLVTLVSPCPSLPHFRGRQPKREGDGRRPPSPSYRGHEAAGLPMPSPPARRCPVL